MQREIGSEFWLEDSLYQPVGPADYKVPNQRTFLSGRTALEYIIRDILQTRRFRRVLLPSYCCNSMIEPFVRNHVDVAFYCVTPEEIVVEESQEADGILLVDFFGYPLPELVEIACRAKKKDWVVIYDGTHKLDGNRRVETFADYSFCSYRKWLFCNFALAKKYTGGFCLPPLCKTNGEYCGLRLEAAQRKQAYILGDSGDKDAYLRLFAQAETLLEGDYVDYCGEPVSVAIASIAQCRRENAAVLMEGLRDIPGVSVWKEHLDDADVPLFVPILVEPEKRDGLRRYLIHNQVYCPVHWPLTKLHQIPEENKMLYASELSLVCDQRYGTDEMKRIIALILEFLETDRCSTVAQQCVSR